ncbi:MAG: RNA polymerase recycling motor ATPase HelR [Candidatus Nanopelagicales bacterium]
MRSSIFDLPERLSAKADPALVGDDEQHFAAIAESLERTTAELERRLDTAARSTARPGQEAVERDQEVHRISARLRALGRYGVDLCLGRMVAADDPRPVYVGRLGLTDADGRRLLVDWRSPAAEPFFRATLADPRGLASRRRYRWTLGRVTDYWDEVFRDDLLVDGVALDDQSAFIASLGADRSPRMRDVLGTLAADQDAIIRAPGAGALVVDGGPGTGKTVVALHRAAYLLYADPRLGHRRGGVLVVGPHRPYLDYVADVLPSLGEEGVLTTTLRDLVPEGADAPVEPDPVVARLKSTVGMVGAIEAAVRFYEQPPAEPLLVETDWSDVVLDPQGWADAFASRDVATPHNEARDEVWEALLDLLVDRHGDDVPVEPLRRALARDDDLRAAFAAAWPLLEPTDLVADLWRVPAYLRLCAPHLTPDEARVLRRDDPYAWTDADLPLLDAARLRLGDPSSSRRRRTEAAVEAAERAAMDLVVDELLASDDDEKLMAQLRQDGLRDALVDQDALPGADRDRLAGPFAHVVVDEAQELTDAQWQMLLARCPSRGLTVVGDRAQARHGFAEPWAQRLARVGLGRVEVATLSINYRTPEEVMAYAEPVIRAAIPDANVPTSIRSTGAPVLEGSRADLDAIVDTWLAEHELGVVCVVGEPAYAARERVSSLPPELVKGLEFDLVVVVGPESFGEGVEGAVDRYVAMTRATRQLVVLR